MLDWDFGDGASETGQVVSHTYTAAGTYTVTLTVSNSQGDEVVTSPIVVNQGTMLPWSSC